VGLDRQHERRHAGALGDRLAMATEKSQAAMHENGLRPSGIYSVEGNLNQEQHERLTEVDQA
jgi:hypothetical protein